MLILGIVAVVSLATYLLHGLSDGDTPEGEYESLLAKYEAFDDKEELEEGDKWAKIYIYVFIGLFAISYVVTSGMFASLGIAIVGFIVFYIIKMLSQKGNDEEKAKIKAAMQFYDECRKIDLSDFTSEKNIARAEAIVKAHHCGEVSDYAVFYELGAKYSKELNDKVASEEKQERVSKLTE